jgi:hypothetical protein
MRLKPPQAIPATDREMASWCRQAVEIEPYYVTPTGSQKGLPDGSGPTTIILVPDEAGGEVLAFNDSAGAWRRLTDRAVVS